MIIKSTVQTEVEMEITFPYCCRFGETYLKVISEKKAISVDTYSFSYKIRIGDVESLTGIIAMSEKCTESEFDKAFDLVFDKIANCKKEEAL